MLGIRALVTRWVGSVAIIVIALGVLSDRANGYGEMVDYPLAFPVDGPVSLRDTFDVARGSGQHQAQDLMAPAGGSAGEVLTIVVGYRTRGSSVLDLQTMLDRLEHTPGPLNGIFGPKTRSAIVSFQAAADLGENGIVDQTTWDALTAATATATIGTTTATSSTTSTSTTSTSTSTTSTSTTSTSTTSTSTTVPQGEAVTVSPGDNLQLLVNQNPEGTRFVLTPGVYRMQAVKAKAGNTFAGQVGAILNGSKILTDFQLEGGLWVVRGQDQEARPRGTCFEDRPGCAHNTDLFVDDVPLEQVLSLGEVASGTWFFDYAADTIYMADDPTGHVVEASVTEHAFKGRVPDVTIRGLVIEKYANRAQFGAVFAIAGVWEGGVVSSPNWVIENNEFRLNHGPGLSVSDYMIVRNNSFHNNGQQGLQGGGIDVLVENNQVFSNGWAGFDPWWDAGGMKFSKTEGLIVRTNLVHDNDGKGIWVDIDNRNTLVEDNHVYENTHQGIYEEISYDAVIRNNLVESNGFAQEAHIAGAGIMVNSSPNVEVYGNTVIGNKDGIAAMAIGRGGGAYGLYELRGLSVHDNHIEMTEGQTGIIDFKDDPAVFTSMNNRFENNTYQIDPGLATPFQWDGAAMTKNEWVAAGNDTTGSWLN
ncbi:MAG: right-handed parallel beta-helix repeat-containing protein [Acidimicrobiia bacterium]